MELRSRTRASVLRRGVPQRVDKRRTTRSSSMQQAGKKQSVPRDGASRRLSSACVHVLVHLTGAYVTSLFIDRRAELDRLHQKPTLPNIADAEKRPETNTLPLRAADHAVLHSSKPIPAPRTPNNLTQPLQMHAPVLQASPAHRSSQCSAPSLRSSSHNPDSQ
ncbi:hypothetical protein DFJ74DRAFT_648565 [Hyaloraphidium curvatum]|nr:hypothetical protein DFJ74DRAFT_698224 [Hyaloraphidium curvatum]KAI9034198.1 hypothetical protein DFJ74DRAFT_648565 [Hyaloraphidium curvatum]